MMREEDIEKAILERDKALDKEALERLVAEKLKNSPFLTRRGALLIILEEKRIARELLKSSDYGQYIPLNQLTPGLQSISIAGRVLGIRRTRGLAGEPVVVVTLSDGSGTIAVVCENLEFPKDMSVGDAVGFRNCNAVRWRNKLAARSSSRTLIEKLHDDHRLPAFETFFEKPDSALVKGLDNVNLSAVVLYDTQVRRSRNNVDVNYVVITDGDKPYLLHAYHEHAEEFANGSSKKFYAANLLIRDGSFYTVKETCITFRGEDPETRKKVLSSKSEDSTVMVVGFCVDGLPVALGRRGEPYRIPIIEHMPTQTFIKTANSFVFIRREVPNLIFEKYQIFEESEYFAPRIFMDDLEAMKGRVVDSVIEAELMRKTGFTYVETKFGRRAFLRFWAKVCGKTYTGVAWGEAAVKLVELREKHVFRMAFPVMKKNRFGELEINVDGLTAVF